jgi:Leucine-rich repeat (LRR) protein/protocatechuate 3,4-dioxygenase beta subunit
LVVRARKSLFRKILSLLLVFLLMANAYVPVGSITYAEQLVTSIDVVISGENGVEHAFGDSSYEVKYFKQASLKVKAILADGTAKDVTNDASFSSLEGGITVSPSGIIKGVADAAGSVIITYQNKQALVDVNSNWDYVSGSYVLNVLSQPVYEDLTAPEVVFAESQLEKAVRKQLNKYIGTITKVDMAQLTSLDVSYQGLTNLAGIESALNLKELYLEGNRIKDLSPLQHLTNLQMLKIGENQVEDLAPLAGLHQLTELYAGKNNLATLAPLAGLANLSILEVEQNQITSLEPLQNVTALTALDVRQNQIDDLALLANLHGLTELDFSLNQVAAIDVLNELSGLRWVNGRGNPVNPEADAILLQLDANGVYVENTEYDPTIIEFEDVQLERALSEQLGIPAPLKKGDLRDINLLDLRDKGITSLKGLEHAQELEFINLGSNFIKTIDELLALPKLNVVELRRNPLQDDVVSVLAALEIRENPPYVNYDLGYDSTPVEIEDVNLANYLIEIDELTKPITKGDLLKYDEMFIANENIASLKGLEHASNLVGLTVWGNRLTSIQEVQHLEQLRHLDITRNPLDTSEGSETHSIIKTLEAKEAVVLYDGAVDGTPVEIADPNFINALTEGNGIQVVKGDLNQLTLLSLSYKGIARLDGIEHATKVTSLFLNDNRISDLQPLTGLKQLTDLDLSQNNIRDLSPLLELTNLKSVNLRNNYFDATANTPASQVISTLQARGVKVAFNEMGQRVIKGKVVDENGPLTKYSYIAGSGFQTAWDNSGEFALKLSDGTHKVTGIYVNNHQGYHSLSMSFEVKAGKLYVDGQLTDRLEVKVPTLATVIGSVKDESGAPVTNSQVNFEREGASFSTYTDWNGQFEYKLSDGQYSVSSVLVGSESVSIKLPFEIRAGKLYVNGESKETLEVVVPSVTLNGIVVDENGLSVPEAEIRISHLDKSYWIRVVNGRFTYRLADGHYRVTSITYQNDVAPQDVTFEMKEGKVYVGGVLTNQLEIKLRPITVKGTITNEQGQLIPNGFLRFERNQAEGFGVYADSLGNFNLRLGDGQYSLSYSWNGGEQVDLNIPVELREGILYVNGKVQERLDVSLPGFSLVGSLLDADGSPLANVNMWVGNDNRSYLIQTDAQGKFKLRLADGLYKISSVSLTREGIPLHIPFEIRDGKLYINNELKDQLEVKLPPVTVSGQVVDENGVPVPKAELAVYGMDRNYRSQTDTEGNFQFRLADGSYELRDVRFGNETALQYLRFEVKAGKLYIDGQVKETLAISLLPVTVIGKVLDENGHALTYSSLYMGKLGQGFNVQPDAQGNFKVRLADGNYEVFSIWNSIDGVSLSVFIPFQVQNGKLYINGEQKELFEIKLPPITFKGQVVDENGNPITNGFVHYESKTQGSSAQTDSQGKFSKRLSDGTYQITKVTSGNEVALQDVSFEIKGGKLYVNGEPAEQLEVKLLPVTVVGSLLDENNQIISNASINFTKDSGKGFGISTDTQGKFRLRLSDGMYRVFSLWNGKEEVWFNQTFEVRDGKLFVGGNVAEQLEVKLAPITLKGQLLDERGTPIANARITIDGISGRQDVTTDSMGQYSARLVDGSYQIIKVADKTGSTAITIPFELVGGKLMVDGKPEELLTVHLLPITFKGKITYQNGSPVEGSSLYMRDTTRNLWHSLKIGYDGSISGRLPDGEYHIYRVNDMVVSNWFSMKDGKIIVNNQVEEQLNLKLTNLKTVTILVKDFGQVIPNATVYVSHRQGMISTGYVTNSNGMANVTLQDGSYLIDAIWKDGLYHTLYAPIYFEVKDGKIFVDGVERENVIVQLNPEKVVTPSGLIVKAKGRNMLHLAWDHQEAATYYRVYRSTTKDGVYKFVETVYNSNEFIDRNLAPATTYWYKLVAGNRGSESDYSAALSGTTTDGMMKGKLVKGDTPLARLTFSLYSLGAETTWYDFTTDDNGEFLLELPDGQYQIDGIWDEPNWYPLGKKFSVTDGLLDVELLIDVAVRDKNVTGILTNEGAPLGDLVFSIRTTSGEEIWYDSVTDANGHFGFNLPDGTYLLEGIWDPTVMKWYVLNYQFTVKDGKLVGASELLVDVNPPVSVGSISGSLTKGTAPLGDTVFSIRTATGAEIWYDTITDENGRFVFELPDGTYVIFGIWVEATGEWFELNQTFTVSGGKLEGASELVIEVGSDVVVVPDFNVTGTLMKGTAVIPDTIFSIRTASGAEIWYDAKTDENGQFGFNLPDGTYVVVGIWVAASGEWFELNREFTVVNGELDGADELVIDVKSVAPAFNVVGTLKKGNETLPGTIFSLRTATGDEIWYDTQTDQNGRFGFNLPDGKYIIEGIWIQGENKWYTLKKEITVNGSLEFDITLE